MNENLDLTSILDGCPEGTEFYHAGYGRVWFVCIDLDSDYPIHLMLANYPYTHTNLTKKGMFNIDCDGECLLFPSKIQRDWSKFERFWKKSKKINKFDPKSLNPFDKILVRKIYGPHNISPWFCEFFSYKHPNTPTLVNGISNRYEICIPYNEETKHLVGTTEDCPEYYKWWEKQL